MQIYYVFISYLCVILINDIELLIWRC